MMQGTKEIQEQMQNKVFEIFQSGKGHKAFAKPLVLQVRAMMYRWKKLGIVMNLPSSDWPIPPRALQ